MGFLTSLFGGPDNPVWTVLIALGVVLVLIVLGVWALKLVFKASSNVSRGRNRRVAVIDSAPVDQRRQLLLIRRDDVEHLLLIGGGQDIVVETGIPVAPAQPARPVRRADALRQTASEPPLQAVRTRSAPPPAAPRLDDEETPRPPTLRSDNLRHLHPESAVDRLRELGRPASERRSGSLRNTGLLRPVSRMEPADIPEYPEIPEPLMPDSGTTGPQQGDRTPFASREGSAGGEPDTDESTRRDQGDADQGY